ncbi:MAG: hypothetical protein EXS08_01110 [Planctomycetes bacterium]|nr:hypothetical protein [Planctomycetota bacterium]
MMVSKSLILAGAALALFGASASAQSQSGKVFARYNKPLKSATLDLATGTITRGPAVNNRAATTVVDFNNNDLGGFVGVDTGGGFCEWFDAGVKGFAGNNSDLMNDVVFAYCSSMLVVGSGGPGGSVKLGFYEGYTVFGGAPTTGVAKFTLTGLPANSASSSFFGGFNCFFIRVFFGTLVSFCDGPIGYSWKFIDTGADGTLAGTWPFLSCVTSCSGAILQTDGQGMTDAIDEFCPPGTLRATFTFGTTSGSFTSMSMDVREVTDLSATANNFNASITPNADILDTSLSRPVDCQGVVGLVTADPDGGATVGGIWVARVTGHSTFGGPLRTLNAASMTVGTTGVHVPANGLNPPPGVGGRKLCVGFLLGPVAMVGVIGVPSERTYTQVIPKSLSLVCVGFCAQSVCVGPGGAKLSSASEGTSGTN